MKNYIVKSFHDVFKDDYEKGEGDRVNGYAFSDEVKAGSPKEAITKYLQDILGYNLDFNNCEVSPEYNNLVQTSCLVDAYNQQPDDATFEAWKKGRVSLYSNHIDIFVYEVNEVVFN